jgi:hypothetical protein
MIFSDGSPVPCDMSEECRNSPQHAGEEHTKCHGCSLSPEYSSQDGRDPWRSFPSYWKPIGDWTQHPELILRKVNDRKSRREEARLQRLAKDKDRQKRAVQATRAEARSNRTIIKATKNSGRSYKDGDHVAASRITLDTKLQSQRINPVVNLRELDKVRIQARQSGTLLGGLVLRGKNDTGVVVIHEDDFGKLLLLITKETNEDNADNPRSSGSLAGPDQTPG